jgi:hypothetical protein
MVAMSDVFGDLRDWRGVLATLDHLRADGQLDRHQDGLARLVRCRENPRLQLAAVESALQIGASSDLLVADTLNAVACRESSLAPSGFSQFDLQRAFQTLQHVAAREQPPPLAQALQEALNQAKPRIVGGSDT